jgi:hypothetical protein
MARRRSSPQSTEALEAFVGCVAGLGILAGVLPQLIQGVYGMALGGMALLFAALSILGDLRDGRSGAVAVVRVLWWGGLAFGLVYGLLWYFTVYLASQPLFTFPGAPAP